MDKAALIVTILSTLETELSQSILAAKATAAAASDGDSKAENKYDTRNLEASYLARGQGFRVAELRAAVADYQALVAEPFRADQPIGPGAFVLVRQRGEDLHYFLGPAAGGTEVQHEGKEVLVTTISSPLGKLLLKRRAGETLSLNGQPVQILAVC